MWPEPNSSAAGSRMMQLIAFFKTQGYTVYFASACAKTENAFDLKQINVEQISIKLNDSGFNTFITELTPDIVLFDRFMVEEQFGWRVAQYCPNAIRVLDTEDLHGLRKGRQQAYKNGKPFTKTYLFNDTTKREIASIYRSDLSLIISEAEMELLKTEFKIDETLLLYLPFMLDNIAQTTIDALPKFKQRKHFIFIGNFLHEPNYNAVLWLKTTIWPLIKQQLPNAEMHVYGAYGQQKALQLNHKKDGFLIKGFTENVNPVMQNAKLCLAPIRFGAGLKGKLIDAMQNGTPCITSSIGAEGMYGHLPPNGYVEDNPETFAQKAVALYCNEDLWNAKQQNGFNILNTRFNKSNHEETFVKTLETLTATSPEHRLNNFIGQMLQYQTMQATKYMGKWIEAKNKTPKQ